jgi:hypothetical protein
MDLLASRLPHGSKWQGGPCQRDPGFFVELTARGVQKVLARLDLSLTN